MKDVQLLISIREDIYTILLNECSGGGPWISRKAYKNGERCDLGDVDRALSIEYDLIEQTTYSWEHDDALERLWDKILIPALALAKASL